MIRSFELLILLLPWATLCYDYDFVVDNEKLYSPCNDDLDNFIVGNFVNVEHLKIEFVSDEIVKFNGDFYISADIDPTDTIELSVEVFKRVKIQWVPTIINFKRKNMCQYLFDPFEPSSAYFRRMPKEQQKCPIVKVAKFSFHDVALSMRAKMLPDPFLDGEYKAVVEKIVRRANGTEKMKMCGELPFHLYRV